MLFVLSIFTAISCLLWPLQFMSRGPGNTIFLNVFFASSWFILASAYVYRECFSSKSLNPRKARLLPKNTCSDV